MVISYKLKRYVRLQPKVTNLDFKEFYSRNLQSQIAYSIGPCLKQGRDFLYS
jgi:hypothetical protein